MWGGIISVLLSIVNSIVGLFVKKQDAKTKAVDDAQTVEKVKAAEVIREVQVKDKSEDLVSKIQHAATPQDKQKALDEIRKKVSS